MMCFMASLLGRNYRGPTSGGASSVTSVINAYMPGILGVQEMYRTKMDDEAALLPRLLRGKLETASAPDQLARKAHHRWDRGKYLAAAVLFEAAARRATAERTS